jgi:hypothetical protein
VLHITENSYQRLTQKKSADCLFQISKLF